jgi:hypothetical protein
MDCVKCRELKRVFELRLTQYVEARASAYYRVSTDLAARRNVDMERSKNDWEEHQMVCASVLHFRDTSEPHGKDTAFKSGEAGVAVIRALRAECNGRDLYALATQERKRNQ